MSEPQGTDSELIFSSDSLVVIFEGRGENIRRPRRLNNPRDWPRRGPAKETHPPAGTPPLPSDGNGQ